MKTIVPAPPPLEILIVDDDKITSIFHGRILKKFSFNSSQRFFSHGKEAIEYLNGLSGNNMTFLVLLDLNMPVMDGWTFLEKCKELENFSRISVIVVTSMLNISDLNRALEYKNLIGFSFKPFTEESMTALLQFQAIKNIFPKMDYKITGKEVVKFL